MLEAERHAIEVRRRLMWVPKKSTQQDSPPACEQPQQVAISDPIAELRQEIDKLWKALNKKRELEPPPPPELRVNEIIALVAADYGISRRDITAFRRDKPSITPRHVAMWLARVNTSKSYSQIGHCFAREHSTVLTNLKRFKKKLATDDALRERVLRLQTLVHERTAALERPAE